VAIGSSEAAHDLNGAQATIQALPALAGRVSLLYLALYLHFGFFNLINLWLKETGSLPDEINKYVMFTAAISAQSPNQQAARKLLEFLKTPEATAVIKSKGNEPS